MLVELLVVIGLIALLIALLLPALGAARESANRVKCLANLRSMAQAAHLHATEHCGYMPAAGYCGPSVASISFGADGLADRDRRKYMYRGEVPVTLPEALGYYMGLRDHVPSGHSGEQVLAGEPYRSRFTCPSQDPDTIRRGHARSDDFHAAIGPRVSMSYIFNGSFLGRTKFAAGESPAGRVDKVRVATSVFLFADGNPDVAGRYYIHHAEYTDGTMVESYHGSVGGHFDHARHRGRMNVVFVDGHAETLLLPDLKRPFGREYGYLADLDRAWVSRGLIYW